MKLYSLVSLGSIAFSIIPAAIASAQVIPDNTLGSEGSTVTTIDQLADRIEGGAARGANLFHSFQEFNVGDGRSIHFVNPTGIENILTRVTGTNPSNILGTLGVLGNANLFLLNPNGIFFGPNAKLDIRGSFFASTAEEIRLGENGVFSAINPEGSNLLNVDTNAIFTNALANHLEKLDNQGSLAVGEGETLSLQGGDLSITGSLAAPGGTIEVRGTNVAIAENAINLSANNVALQANNDITINTDIIGTDVTRLELQAGKSIALEENRTISLDGGDFNALINDGNARETTRDSGTAQFVMNPESQIITNGGNVSIEPGSFNNIVVGEVRLDGGTINAGGGEIAIAGRGRNGGDANVGIRLGNSAVLETIGSGNITFEGIGGNGTSANRGISSAGESRISTVDGTIALRGTGGTGTGSNEGISLVSSTRVEATGSGQINLTGRGGIGRNDNNGIVSLASILSSRDGDITIRGVGGGSEDGNNNTGIRIENRTIIASTESGNITIDGTGGTGEEESHGTSLVDATVGAVDGIISVSGTSLASPGDRFGIVSKNSSLESTGRGEITLTGTANGMRGISLEDSTINAASRDGRGRVTLASEAIALQNSQIQGNGILQFQSISSTGDLNLNLDGLSKLGDVGIAGFEQIAIGAENSSGRITVTGVGNFNDPTRVRSPAGNGAIDTTGAILFGFDDATITLEANQNITAGSIFVPDGTVNLASVRGLVEIRGEIADRNSPSTNNTPLVADNSLGTEHSRIVAIDANSDKIEGGATRGNTTVHSFSEFNVGLGRSVYFASESGVANILSRVTGNAPTTIFGTLGVEGDANLFLINRNGIILTPFARLDLNGSFAATTADAIRLADGGIFSSNIAEQLPENLNPSGLIFQGENRGTITSAADLQVKPGRDLLLAGGTVNIGGDLALGSAVVSGNSGRLQAPGGSLQIAAIASGEWNLAEATLLSATNASRSNSTQINAGNSTLSTRAETGDSGNVTLFSQGDITAGPITANAVSPGSGGDIEMMARGDIIAEFINASGAPGGDVTMTSSEGAIVTFGIMSATVAGKGGDVLLQAAGNIGLEGAIGVSGLPTGQISLTGGGNISIPFNLQAFSFGGSNGGNIALEAESIFIEDAAIAAVASSVGNSGNIVVNADREVVLRNGRIATVTEGGSRGDSGNVTLNTGKLTIIQEFGSAFETGVATLADPGSSGNSGDLTINATEAIEIIGDRPGAFTPNPQQLGLAIIQGDTGIATSALGSGNAGNLTINTGQLEIRNGAGIATAAVFGEGGTLNVNAAEVVFEGEGGLATTAFGIGDAGDLTVSAERVTLSNGAVISADVLPLEATPDGGNAGELRINTANLLVGNGSRIGASTASVGNGGELIINASESVEVVGSADNGTVSSGIAANSLGMGNAGNVEITTAELTVINGGEISVSSLFTSAGDLEINADEIRLDNGMLTADTAARERGNINLQADTIQLRRESAIATNATGDATGGNITINTDTLVALEDSDITANAEESSGGRVIINTQAIFGTQFREFTTNASDITASSNLGPQFSGVVEINTPDVDPAAGLVDLSTDVIDAEALFSRNPCAVEDDKIAGGSSFTISGRGGLPPTPHEPLTSITGLVEWAARSTETERTDVDEKVVVARSQLPQLNPENIRQARGWIQHPDGTIILTENPVHPSPANYNLTHPTCQGFSGQ